METFLKFVGGTVLVLALLVGISVAFAFPTKWLVNYMFTDAIRVALFGVAKISVWRALWLNMLCGFLFKGNGSVSAKS